MTDVPLILTQDGALRDDRRVAPQLVPLALLGCEMEVTLHTAGGAYVGDAFTLGARVPSHGGAPLRTLYLDDAAFEAKAMMAGGELPFEEMKLPQLKEELAARGSSRSGLKATLQRRLHGLLLEAAMAARQAEAEENGEGMDVDDATEGGDDALPGAAGEAREVMMEKRRAYKARMLDLFGYVSEWDSE